MKLIVINKNEMGLAIAALAEKSKQFTEISFLDEKCKDDDVLSENADYFLYIADDTYFYPAFVDSQWRNQWLHRLMEMGANIATINLSKASTAKTAIITPGLIIKENVTIGEKVRLQPGVIIEENCTIKENTVLEGCVSVKANSVIEENNYLNCYEVVEENSLIKANTTFKKANDQLADWEVRHTMFAESDENALRQRFSHSMSNESEPSPLEKQLKDENDIKDMLKMLKQSGKSFDEIMDFLKKM